MKTHSTHTHGACRDLDCALPAACCWCDRLAILSSLPAPRSANLGFGTGTKTQDGARKIASLPALSTHCHTPAHADQTHALPDLWFQPEIGHPRTEHDPEPRTTQQTRYGAITYLSLSLFLYLYRHRRLPRPTPLRPNPTPGIRPISDLPSHVSFPAQEQCTHHARQANVTVPWDADSWDGMGWDGHAPAREPMVAPGSIDRMSKLKY